MTARPAPPRLAAARRLLLLAALAASALFYLAPAIDLRVSGWVFDGTAFLLGGDPAWRLVNRGLRVVVAVYGVMLLCLLAVPAIGRRLLPGLDRFRVLFLLLCLGIGPGLITNVILKDQWGRARPDDVQAFGGSQRFTPAWVISDQCPKNCSFVSGDVSVVASFLGLALLARRRRTATLLVTALTGAMAALRLFQGGHFLSDVVLGALLTLLSVLMLHGVMFEGWIKGGGAVAGVGPAGAPMSATTRREGPCPG